MTCPDELEHRCSSCNGDMHCGSRPEVSAEALERITRIEGMVLSMYVWLEEIMPAARTAVKLLSAREALTRRWRGGK